MVELLGLVLISFVITSFFIVPFIDLLFYLKRKFERIQPEKKKKSNTPIHDELMKGDEETPSGGGILLVIILISLSIIYAIFNDVSDITSLKILIFTLVGFGSLGLIDDIRWILTKRKGKLLGLGGKYMLVVQIFLAISISLMLYNWLGLNNVYISGLGNFVIGPWYIPLAAFTIVAFSNAYNISDGLDGLSSGLLTVSLFALLALASATLNLTLAAFVGIWLGSLFAYLYFNVYPARIYLGDAGALSFGATLAVVGLLMGKILALGIIGGMFVVIVATSFIQIFSKTFFKRKVFTIAPLHMWLRYIGWEEPKIVVRLWLVQALFAIFGLWLALLSK